MDAAAKKKVWGRDTLAGDPHARGDKARRVRAMFASIAGSYDLNNRLHAFGMDQRWRRVAVGMAAVTPGERVVDVACGTGDLAIALARTLPAAAADGGPSVIGVDFTFAMLPLAEGKSSGDAAAAAYAAGDALRLPLPDACCEAVTIAFGLRNVADPSAAVAEFARVLKPGGRLVVLEFVEPRNPLIRWGNAAYTRGLMPLTATALSGDRSGAYRYLPKSVATFLGTAGVAALYERHGFGGHRSRAMNLGTVDCHAGTLGR
ncbi:ubiquinone/menaquinone biosynthesis methyltransferase [Phycisphaera mikurensis]|uniref:Demethylmenaquinone methyltransferase n=1 Tax=Phycisphaera mikurensis (strain NBRC 102666 / KCTC 22515 / FYK2301M01) TaxID=1142394 RepID=I0IB28_PHYMF|nr:ubiquinone/menaquinone biosynthesis methyltransferase [Phycisphaera mikurensis]MBB6442563.1 demethylmenaquinone methyltransferase/2-methoxy-6-polyprenyl-1,4-benzoquinol methylase [Phycisphaera mikurensis]BAM02466.1 ubiquinone/menaquinone biosynthesis methyltransferase UbiE [Phycisphaera mikurensis NBRC 102666]